MDSVAGDGDHGIGMQRGSRAGAKAARSAAEAGAGAGTTLAEAGDAWSDQGGGTSGVIWGRILQTLGQALGDDAPVDAAAVSAAVGEARDVVMGFGKAQVGDKTMIDAIVPFADDLSAGVAAGRPLREAWPHAADRRRAGRTAAPRSWPRSWGGPGRTATRASAPPTRARCRSPSSARRWPGSWPGRRADGDRLTMARLRRSAPA